MVNSISDVVLKLNLETIITTVYCKTSNTDVNIN